MATEANPTTDPTPAPDAAGSGPQPPASQPAESHQQPTSTDAVSQPPVDPGVPRDEVNALLEKVRREEKEKLYPELDRLKGAKTEGEARIAELEKQLEAQRQEVEGLRTGEVEKAESINRELRELQEKNQKLESAIENVATEAAAKLHASQMAALRERLIRESGIKQLPELVTGDTEEALRASVQQVKEKEEAILEEARAQARAQVADQLPTPISPDGSTGRGPTAVVTPKQKQDIAKLKGAEYQQYRDQLLAEAKQKAGLS